MVLNVKTILVTGGAGFIGSNFIRYMLNNYKTYKIINLDLLTYAGNQDNLLDVASNDNYQFVQGNICDRKLINSLIENNIDIIVNFAAETHVDRSIDNPGIFVETNVMGTQVLLDAAKNHDIERYIQISTDEVYGTLGKNGRFFERSPLAPNSPYSSSKAGADLLVRSYYKTFNLPTIITRCSNNYGPFQYLEKLIPVIILNALEDREIPIYGDGQQIRDWLYVSDHCKAIDLVLHKGRIGEVYNIGANHELTNINLVKMILEQMGKPKSLIKFVKDRPGHDRRYAIDSKKIKEELGWSPEYSFESGLTKTINWYINNKKWLGNRLLSL